MRLCSITRAVLSTDSLQFRQSGCGAIPSRFPAQLKTLRNISVGGQNSRLSPEASSGATDNLACHSQRFLWKQHLSSVLENAVECVVGSAARISQRFRQPRYESEGKCGRVVITSHN